MVDFPKTLTAGDTWQWDADYGDYPASTWTATAYFENSSSSISISSSAVSDTHRFAETAANTADFDGGRYYVQVRVTDGSSVYTVETGWCQVEIDPAKAGNQDRRSWARRTLDAVEAFIEGNATTAQQSVSIAGRTISRWPLSELMQLRDQLRGEVRAEEHGSQAGLGRDIRVRFGRA